jgi:hypothetical protein
MMSSAVFLMSNNREFAVLKRKYRLTTVDSRVTMLYLRQTEREGVALFPDCLRGESM